HVDRVRAPEHLVPLRPRLDDVAVGVDDNEVVLPLRVDAHASLPRLRGILRISARSTCARRAGDEPLRRVAEWHLSHGEREAWSNLRQCDRGWAPDVGQLAALDDVNAIGALRED